MQPAEGVWWEWLVLLRRLGDWGPSDRNQLGDEIQTQDWDWGGVQNGPTTCWDQGKGRWMVGRDYACGIDSLLLIE